MWVICPPPWEISPTLAGQIFFGDSAVPMPDPPPAPSLMTHLVTLFLTLLSNMLLKISPYRGPKVSGLVGELVLSFFFHPRFPLSNHLLVA